MILDICSLWPKVDKLAFSVIWEMTPDAKIVKTSFHKTVIHSKEAFTYGQAQERLDSKFVILLPDFSSHFLISVFVSFLRDNSDPKTVCVKRLNKIARILRSRRIEKGAITLASQEVKFLLDNESQTPTDLGISIPPSPPIFFSWIVSH